MKEFFEIFPDYPQIGFGSKTNKMYIAKMYSQLTWDEIDEIIQELQSLRIIEPCRNNDYILTQRGYEIWQEASGNN